MEPVTGTSGLLTSEHGESLSKTLDAFCFPEMSKFRNIDPVDWLSEVSTTFERTSSGVDAGDFSALKDRSIGCSSLLLMNSSSEL